MPCGKKQASDTEMKKQMWLADLLEYRPPGEGGGPTPLSAPLGIGGTKKSSARWG